MSLSCIIIRSTSRFTPNGVGQGGAGGAGGGKGRGGKGAAKGRGSAKKLSF